MALPIYPLCSSFDKFRLWFQCYRLVALNPPGLFHVQKCDLGSPEDFLSKALDPPQLQVISNAMNVLRKIGACEPDEPKLTPLGQHLAALPVNVKIGKMLIFGAIFGCLEPVVSKILPQPHFTCHLVGKLLSIGNKFKC